MCGRFAQVFQNEELEHIERLFQQALKVDDSMIELLATSFTKSHNIAPTQYATIIHPRSPRWIGTTQAHFGLIPSWAKDRSRSASLNNARSETIHEKPSFRENYRSRRCILPIPGFYEWQRVTKDNKQPWYIHRADESPMLVAGICDTWLDPEHGHSEVDSFSIITTRANAFMDEIHHRMPVIIEPESISLWFDRNTEPRELRSLLEPSPSGVLDGYRVSKRVNSTTNNDSTLIEPDSESGPATLWG